MSQRDSELSSSSVASIGIAESPRPPAGPKPSQGYKQKPRRASSTIRSPYLSSMSIPRSASVRLERERSTVSIRHTGGSLWTNPYLVRTLPKSGVWKKRALSSSQSACEVKHPVAHPQTVDLSGKSVLDLRDELDDTRRLLSGLSSERDGLKAEVNKLKQLLASKDRQIEDFLAEGRVGRKELLRLFGTGGQNGGINAVSSIKHKAHLLEQSLREREEELAALRRDIRGTQLKELQIEKETYYSEVVRLQNLAESLESELSEEIPQSKRYLQKRIDALQSSLSGTVRKLEAVREENCLLLARIKAKPKDDSRQTVPQAEAGAHGKLATKYLDMLQSELISAAVALELKLLVKESTIVSLNEELKKLKAESKESDRASRSEVASMRQKLESLQAELEESRSTIAKLRRVVSKLKEDRTHYRSLAEKTKADLSTTLDSLASEEQRRREMEEEVKRMAEQEKMEHRAREHAAQLGRRGKQLFDSSARKSEAAVVIQTHWRRTRAAKQQRRFEDAEEKTAALLQAALRSHHTREEMLKNSLRDLASTDKDGGDLTIIEMIQSALRAHRTRLSAIGTFQQQ